MFSDVPTPVTIVKQPRTERKTNTSTTAQLSPFIDPANATNATIEPTNTSANVTTIAKSETNENVAVTVVIAICGG